MSDFLNLLSHGAGKQYIESGAIVSISGDGIYTVNINGVFLKAESAVDGIISVGTNVVINRVEDRRYIIGITNQLKTKTEKEIIING